MKAIVAAITLLLGLMATAWAAEFKGGTLTVEAPWARASVGPNGAVFLTIKNSGAADVLVGASTEMAGETMLHVTSQESGVMKMRAAGDGLPVPAHGTTVLQPGGYHIMLMGMRRPLKDGTSFPLKLKFKNAGDLPVRVDVGNAGAMQPPALQP